MIASQPDVRVKPRQRIGWRHAHQHFTERAHRGHMSRVSGLSQQAPRFLRLAQRRQLGQRHRIAAQGRRFKQRPRFRHIASRADARSQRHAKRRLRCRVAVIGSARETCDGRPRIALAAEAAPIDQSEMIFAVRTQTFRDRFFQQAPRTAPFA